MSEKNSIKNTWEKVLEYASMPLHGTMSRKLRKGVKLMINGNTEFDQAVIFIGEGFVRLTSTKPDKTILNVYYDIDKIGSIATVSSDES